MNQNTKMKKGLAILLVFAMLFSIMPVSAFAADSDSSAVIYVGGHALQARQYIDNHGNTTDAQPENGGYAYYDGSVLKLHNYEYSGEGYLYRANEDSDGDAYKATAAVYAAGNITIELSGINVLTNTYGKDEEIENTWYDGDGIVSEGDVVINGNGDGILLLTGSGGIAASGDVTITKVKDLQITAKHYDGIYSEKGDILITDSIVKAAAAEDGLYTYNGDIVIGSTEVEAVLPVGSYPRISGTTITILAGISAGPGYAAICANKDSGKNPVLSVDEKLAITVPENGKIVRVDKDQHSYKTICDETGAAVTEVIIKPLSYAVNLATESGNFGIPVPAGQSVTKAYGNEAVSQMNTLPTKDGYTFQGWYSDETLTTAYDFTLAVNEEITLYPKWLKTCLCTDADKDYKCDKCGEDFGIRPSSGSSGGFSGTYNYPVTAADADGAEVTLSDNHASAGETVTITVKPEAGKQVDEVIVTDADGDVIPVTRVSDNQYTFTMPAGKVNIEITTEAAEYALRIVMQINNKNIAADNRTIANDAAPVIVGDRTLVPVRAVTELLGGKADWDGATRTVTLTIDGKVLKLVIGEEIPGYGTSAAIINNRTYVPVRYVMEKLGANVEWVAATQQIIIEK